MVSSIPLLFESCIAERQFEGSSLRLCKHVHHLVDRPVSVPASMQLLMSPCRGMGTKFVPFCCQKRGNLSFYIFPLLSALSASLLLQWTPMKKLLISFFNNDDSDNCRRLLIRPMSVHENESELLRLSLLDYLHRLLCWFSQGDGRTEERCI